MDEQELLIAVRAAGLESTFSRFADDVRAAALLARAQGTALGASLPPELAPCFAAPTSRECR